MAITYGGIPLLMTDPGGAAQAFLDRYQPMAGMLDQTASAAQISHRTSSRSSNRSGCGLPVPNYPPPPKPAINTLWWPTGAARWARGYFLAASSQVSVLLELIKKASKLHHEPLELVMGDGHRELKAKMYLLPPRRISGWPEPSLTPPATPKQSMQSKPGTVEEGLYLLPLVDERFYWQYAECGDLDGLDSWDDLYGRLRAKLGLAFFSSAVDAKYGIPDPDELAGRDWENAAVLLDALAHSTGATIVRDGDGQVEAMNWGNSEIRLTKNLKLQGLVAGGMHHDNNGILPDVVQVTFPRYYQGGVDQLGNLHAEERKAKDFDFFKNARPKRDTKKTIHSTAHANFSTDPFATSPDNPSEISDLAGRIAEDFYLSLKYRYDLTYGGLLPWQLTGYDDSIEFSLDHHRACTRVHSAPVNFGAEEQLQQFQSLPLYPNPSRFKLTAVLAPGGQAEAKHVTRVGGTLTPVDHLWTLNVHDPLQHFGGAIDDYGWARLMPDSRQWETVSMRTGSKWIEFRLTAPLTINDATATVAVLRSWGGDPGVVTVVHNIPTSNSLVFGWEGIQNAIGLAVYDDKQGRWPIVDLECP